MTTPVTTTDVQQLLIDYYGQNDAAAAHKARDRALRKSDDLRARIRAEVQQLSTTHRRTTEETP